MAEKKYSKTKGPEREENETPIVDREAPEAEKAAAKLTKEEQEEIANEKQRIEILKTFTKEVLKKYGPLIRSIVLFGSTARRTARGESDIDVFVIVDDTRQKITPAMREKLEDDLDIIAKKSSKLMSVQQPYMLTEFWRFVREGHPIVFNFIREGIPVYDKDIFMPIKRLLQMGEIKPSKEAVEKFIERSPKRVSRVENAKIYMVVEDLYYGMMESAQAVIMFLGHAPPRPNKIGEAIRKVLIPMKLVDEKYAKYIEELIELRKEVEHKRIKSISGTDLDEWIKRTKDFIKKMESLIVKIEILKRENMIEKSYAIMEETTLTLLKALGKKPLAQEKVSTAFKKHLVTTGIVDENYLKILETLEDMKQKVKAGKVMDIEKRDILVHREYVRKFIREAGRVLKKKTVK